MHISIDPQVPTYYYPSKTSRTNFVSSMISLGQWRARNERGGERGGSLCGEGDVQFSFSTSASHDVMMKELEDLLAEAVALQEVALQEVALQEALQEDEMRQVPSRRATTLFCID